ncbi:MAG: lipopolysaccharide assembly protein LapA domain-containing protein [Gaiellaceae bacterium]
MTEEPNLEPQKSSRPGLSDRLEETRQTFQPGLWSRLIALAVIAIYVLLFVVLNTRHVHVDFVFASPRVSLIWVILLSLGVGVVLGVLLSQLHRRRQRSR